jgi:hypothetical protein
MVGLPDLVALWFLEKYFASLPGKMGPPFTILRPFHYPC